MDAPRVRRLYGFGRKGDGSSRENPKEGLRISPGTRRAAGIQGWGCGATQPRPSWGVTHGEMAGVAMSSGWEFQAAG